MLRSARNDVPDANPRQPQQPSPTQVEVPPKTNSEFRIQHSEFTQQSPEPVIRQRPRGGGSTISITSTLEAAKKEEEVEPTWDSPFTQEQLEASWTEFVNRYKKISPNFAAGLGKYKPELRPGFEIHFPVDNMLFESDTEGMTALRSHLKNTLHNNQYKLVPELMEKPAQVEAYTDKEKFEKLAEAHPELRKLQLELKLEGDL